MTAVGTRRVRNASARGWKRLPLDVSLHDLAAPPITVRPERTLHTFFAFWVVNAFLMRAADDAIDSRHRFGSMLIDESYDCFSDFRIASRIGCFAKPPLNRVGVGIFVRDDSNGDLRRSRVVWPVEGNRRHGIAAEIFASFFCKLVSVPLSLKVMIPLSRALRSDVSGVTEVNTKRSKFFCTLSLRRYKRICEMMAVRLSKERSQHRRERAQWCESHGPEICGGRSTSVSGALEPVVISSAGAGARDASSLRCYECPLT